VKLFSENAIFTNILNISDMKEAIVNPDLTVTVHNNAPIPTPAATQILIKIVCAGCNPKDWKRPFFSKTSSNSGDDMAGIVSSVGTSVLEFKPGDRVAAFHTMEGSGGAFAEYGLAESWTTFHIPDGTSFEEVRSILHVP
jgi:NADPH:quinone reductase